jgi:hypothetical protein
MENTHIMRCHDESWIRDKCMKEHDI